MITSAEQGVYLDLPSKPNTDNIDDLAEDAMNWIKTNVPYDIATNLYRPEMAQEAGGGNCYAQTLGGVMLLQNWAIPSAVVLDSGHAHFALGIEDEVRFVDMHPNNIVLTIGDEAEQRSGVGLDKLYAETLPSAMQFGDFAYYFCPINGLRPYSKWERSYTCSLEEDVEEARDNVGPHVIVDGDRGIDMLLATGDLKRYQKRKPEMYEERYYELIQYVPDFIHLAPPVT